MTKLIDLTGHKFGMWTVISQAESYKNGAAQWHCRCDCGTERIVLGSHLISGHSKSCGCPVPYDPPAPSPGRRTPRNDFADFLIPWLERWRDEPWAEHTARALRRADKSFSYCSCGHTDVRHTLNTNKQFEDSNELLGCSECNCKRFQQHWDEWFLDQLDRLYDDWFSREFEAGERQPHDEGEFSH